MVHMDFIPVFCTLHSISLISSQPPTTTSSLCCLARSHSLVFLALAGHAAAAELFGSLGFMVAALLLSNDGLVNSDLQGCGEAMHPLHPTALRDVSPQGSYDCADFLSVV